MDRIRVNTAVADSVTLDAFLEAIDYRAARSREELQKAYELVYREYLKRGYVKESISSLKLSIYNALPQTATFVAAVDKDIVATATVIVDSPLGLPMDAIYHQELEQLRQNDKRLCEISMLASETELFRGGISLMLNAKKMFFIFSLFKVIFDYATHVLKLDYICITINPKHNLTYDFMLFKTFGELKTYDSVNGAPAIAKYLDLNSAEAECKARDKEGLYRMFFLRKTLPDTFDRKVALSPEDLRYFFVEKTDIFKNLSPAQIGYLKSCYPAHDFTKILK